MRVSRPVHLLRTTALVGALALIAACGSPGQSGPTPGASGTSAPPSTAKVCEAVPGEKLVALEDDLNLQNPDNVIPAANAEFATANPDVLTALEPLVKVLDTPALVGLNKAVDVDRQSSAAAAKAFIADNNLAAGTDVGGGAKVIVGAPGFAEGVTLASLYAQILTSAGFDATLQDVGNRELYLADLTSGQVTIMPEYASTLTEFLNVKANGQDAAAVATPDLDATVGELKTLAADAGLSIGMPAPAQDQNTYAVTTGFAETNNLKTLSDLATNCSGLVLGGPPECAERSFCKPGLESKYALNFASFVSLDAGGPLTKAALRKGDVTLGMVLSSDSDLAN